MVYMLVERIRDTALTLSDLKNQLQVAPDSDLEQLFRERYLEYKVIERVNQQHWRRFTYAAIGLFSYGHFEVVYDIIDNLPPYPKEQGDGLMNKWVSGSIVGLLPLPYYFTERYIRDHPEELREWVNANRERIVWDAEQSKYVLQDR